LTIIVPLYNLLPQRVGKREANHVITQKNALGFAIKTNSLLRPDYVSPGLVLLGDLHCTFDLQHS